MIPFADLSAQQKRIQSDLKRRMDRVLSHGRYILGPEVDELEEALANRVGTKHCISVANGTDALQIALMTIGIEPNDEVIVPSFSYIATAEAVSLLGATPVFADVNSDTCLINISHIEKLITKQTKAIIPVSLYGQCADMASINKLADRHQLTVIEDAAQSFGATQGTNKSCALSHIACTSFFPSKPLGCYGDGGALFTDNDHLALIIRQIARHGQAERYKHVRLGINSRLDTLQAAVLLSKLTTFDEDIAHRNIAARAYTEHLSGLGVELPHIVSGNSSVFAQYTIQSDQRNALAMKLKELGVPTMVHYPLALHQQKALFTQATCPISEQLASRVLSLPMHADLREDTIVTITNSIKEAVATLYT